MRRAPLWVLGTALLVVGAGCQLGPTPPPVPSAAPSAPPAVICGNTALLSGPASAPAGSVRVAAGDDSALFAHSLTPNTMYWFAPGAHTLGRGQYSQIVPADGDVFVGAPGAVIDGQGHNDYAFTQQATAVTIEFLTIQGFEAPQGESVVNHDAGTDWTITHNTVQDNPVGAGVGIGSRDLVSYNCLTRNGEYGFNAYSPQGVSNVVLDHNEISHNDTYDWESKQSGCGCSGGGKFWQTVGAYVTNNYVHDNQSVGLWADTDNADFTFAGNYVSGNEAEGIIYEISYNATIANNIFFRNALVEGPTNPGFPTGAIFISESGGDGRVAGPSTVDISGNAFIDNYDGVVLWENADRFCGSPDNTSSDACTLVDPAHTNLTTCIPGTISQAPYIADCRWKTQNVVVHNNSFVLDRMICTGRADCGMNALISNYGTDPKWSPYRGPTIEDAITFHQGNSFRDNTYRGSWRVLAHDQSTTLTMSQWQDAPYGEDVGSTLSPGG